MPRFLTGILVLISLSAVSCSVYTPPPPDPQVITILEKLRERHTGLFDSQLPALAQTIVQEARKAGLEPDVVLAVIHVESSAYNFSVSPVGALGLMQLMPTTAEAEARRLGIPWRGHGTLFDPVANVRLGVAYLRRLVDRFDDLPTALAAYNWGPTHIARRIRGGRTLPAEYTGRVRAAYGDELPELTHST